MNIRLQKLIAQAGICSRRKAEVYIQRGDVTINGELCTKLGTQVDPSKDQVFVLGKKVEVRPARAYYLFYKPRNVVSTLKDPQGRPTLEDFIQKTSERLYPVGRLDFESEGLLILTNDGELTQKISHPSQGVQKRYQVMTNQPLKIEHLQKLRGGGVIEGRRVKPLCVKIISNEKRLFEIILGEGRKREIRELCRQCGLSVVRLVRVAIGSLLLDGLKPGELKPISLQALLKSLSKDNQ